MIRSMILDTIVQGKRDPGFVSLAGRIMKPERNQTGERINGPCRRRNRWAWRGRMGLPIVRLEG